MYLLIYNDILGKCESQINRMHIHYQIAFHLHTSVSFVYGENVLTVSLWFGKNITYDID